MIEPPERERLLSIYAETRTSAVVGASADASKAAHRVPRYLQMSKDEYLLSSLRESGQAIINAQSEWVRLWTAQANLLQSTK